MPEDAQRTPIQLAWLNFVKSVQGLLVPQIDDRPLDQFLPFRDAVLTLVQSEKFLTDFDAGWTSSTNMPEKDEIQEVFLQEIEAFPRAVEVAQATSKPDEAKGWVQKMLGRASTVCDSANDLAEDLPWYAKNGLTLFKESVDLFRGKD